MRRPSTPPPTAVRRASPSRTTCATSRCIMTVWPSRLKVSSDRSLSHSSSLIHQVASTRRPPPARTPARPATCSSSRRTPAADSTAMIAMTRVHMPVLSAARIAARDSSTARATPCGYRWPSSPVRDTSAGIVCSRSRYLAYPWRCPLISGAARASASGRCPSTAATSAAPASSSRPVRPVRNDSASSAPNTSAATAAVRFGAVCRVLMIRTCAVPSAGTNGDSASGSATSSNTSRQRSPSVSSRCRTAWPASATGRPELILGQSHGLSHRSQSGLQAIGVRGVDPGHQPPAGRQLRPRVRGRQLCRPPALQPGRRVNHRYASTSAVQPGEHVGPRLEARRLQRDITHHDLVTHHLRYRRLLGLRPGGSACR